MWTASLWHARHRARISPTLLHTQLVGSPVLGHIRLINRLISSVYISSFDTTSSAERYYRTKDVAWEDAGWDGCCRPEMPCENEVKGHQFDMCTLGRCTCSISRCTIELRHLACEHSWHQAVAHSVLQMRRICGCRTTYATPIRTVLPPGHIVTALSQSDPLTSSPLPAAIAPQLDGCKDDGSDGLNVGVWAPCQ